MKNSLMLPVAVMAIALCLLLVGVASATTQIASTMTITVATATDGGLNIGLAGTPITVTMQGSGTFTGLAGGYFTIGRTAGGTLCDATLIYEAGASQTVPGTGLLCVGYYIGGNDVLTLAADAGTFSYTGTGGTNRIGCNVGTTGSGTLNLYGGTFSSASLVEIGSRTSGTTGSRGYVNQTGGTFTTVAKSLFVGSGTAGSGTVGSYIISGGTLTVGSDLDVSSNQAAGVTSFFDVEGSGATSITVTNAIKTSNNTTFKFSIDAGGVDRITGLSLKTLAGGVETGQALAGVFDLGFVGAYLPASYETYDLIKTTYTGGGAVTSTATLKAEDVPDWDLLNTLNGDGSTTIQARYKGALVPEPATMGLLGLGLLGLVLRRKR